MELFDYQKKLLDEHWQPSLALFMDMGTGKTYTALGAFERSNCKKLLVICLASKVDDWHELIEGSVKLDKGSKKNPQIMSDYANVISFESSWRIDKDLLKWVDEDTYIIVDESHKIKNRKSKLGRFMRKLGKATDYKAILTGTPQTEGYIDYYNQFYFLGHLDISVKEFESKYCKIEHIDYNGYPVKTIVGYKNTDELDEIINKNSIYYSRENDDVPKEQKITLKVPRAYKTVQKDRVYEWKNGEYSLFDTLGSLYSALRTLSSGHLEGEFLNKEKLNWVKDFVEGYNKKLIIFYNFNTERNALKKILKDYPLSEYSGNVKDLKNFENEPNGIVLCNFAAASTGINNLVISNMMIMFSLPTSYIDFAQAKKRIDRIGQEKNPMYYYLVGKNSVEDSIYRNLINGENFDNEMFKKYMEDK